MSNWQVQEAKQRFSEVLRHAHTEGPQIVTRHGEEIAVVIDIEEYRALKAARLDFKDFLRSGPDLSELDIRRASEPAPSIDLTLE
ncbi:type II toxin-antitoxin system Phd/YefM family antitoxin [Microtetraspora fusca]|uniref:Antitoxin n=1 Tax=Microtetraspora fusca TaxID=1997 RepID=A0ABW6V0E8_MICFU|nr:type II toxin-antitoxin system Phd/YefM family antitoxin [Microtetraspora fusca]